MTYKEINQAAINYAKQNKNNPINSLVDLTAVSDRILDTIEVKIHDAFKAGAIFAQKQLDNKWVSVEERLPEFNRFMVLKYSDNHVEILEPCEKNYPDIDELEINPNSDNPIKVTHYKYINID